MRFHTPLAAIAAITAGSLLAACAPASSAPDQKVAAALDAVDAAAGHGALVLAPSAVAADVSVGDLTVRAAGNGGEVELTLPSPAGSEAQRTDGVVVAAGTDSATVQITGSAGVQGLFVLNGPDAATELPIEVDLSDGQSTLTAEADGSVSIRNADGTINSVIATPWAFDADGNAVPTHYEVSGNTIVQHVDTTGVVAWPVVADPFWSSFSGYMKCILGVGVPIGVAAAWVAYIGGAAGLKIVAANRAARYVPGPPFLGDYVRRYGQAVYNNCRWFVLYG